MPYYLAYNELDRAEAAVDSRVLTGRVKFEAEMGAQNQPRKVKTLQLYPAVSARSSEM